MTAQTIEPVAEHGANGHRTHLADDLVHPVQPEAPAPGEQRPAKIDKVAERAAKPKRRTIRQLWRDWRSRRPAKATAKPGAPVADGLDLTRLYPYLTGLVALVVLLTFVLSFHGLFEYAHTIALLPAELSVAVPIGLDVFSLCSLVATFLCANAHWRVRAYCWSTFLVTVGLSVAGNAAFAYAQQVRHLRKLVGPARALPDMDMQQWGAIAGAAIWPALAAGALHLLILSRRHLATQRSLVDQVAADVAEQAADRELAKARAIALWVDEVSVKDISAEIDVPADTIDKWLRPLRAKLAAAAKQQLATTTRGRKS